MIKVVSKTIENEAKEQKGGFLGVLLGTYVIIMSRIRFRINICSIVAWMSKNFLLKESAIS